MADGKLLSADEVAELIGVSHPPRVARHRKLDDELTASWRCVVPGGVNRACLEQKCFGVPGRALCR